MTAARELVAALSGVPHPFALPVPEWLPPEGGSEPDEEDA